MWKKAAVAYLKYCTGVGIAELRETTKSLSGLPVFLPIFEPRTYWILSSIVSHSTAKFEWRIGILLFYMVNAYCGSRTRRSNPVKAKNLHSASSWTSSVHFPSQQTICLRSVFVMSSAHFRLSTVFQLTVFQYLSHVRCRSEPHVSLAYILNFNCSVLA